MTIFYHSVAADCCNAFNFKGGPSLKRTRLQSAWKEHIENANCCCCDCLALNFFFFLQADQIELCFFLCPLADGNIPGTEKHAFDDDDQTCTLMLFV